MTTSEIINAILGLFGLSVLFIQLYIKRYDDGYKDGQLDALTGKVKYEKKENGLGEIVWTEINTEKP
jgi:hypothetical protein